jgi:YVTN family beta-propeller protein
MAAVGAGFLVILFIISGLSVGVGLHAQTPVAGPDRVVPPVNPSGSPGRAHPAAPQAVSAGPSLGAAVQLHPYWWAGSYNGSTNTSVTPSVASWWQIGAYNGNSGTYPSLSVTLTIPDAEAEGPGTANYAVLMSAFDNGGAYDQIGIGDYYGHWVFSFNYLPPGANPNVLSNYDSWGCKTDPQPNEQYTFDMSFTSGYVVYLVYLANTSTSLCPSAPYHDGATAFHGGEWYNDGSYGQFSNYADYEEMHLTGDQYVPDWDWFYFGNTATTGWSLWTAGSAPSGVTVATSGAQLTIENEPLVFAVGTSWGSGSMYSTTANAGSQFTVQDLTSIICSCSPGLAFSTYQAPLGWYVTFTIVRHLYYATVTTSCESQPGTYYVGIELSMTISPYLFTKSLFSIGVAVGPRNGALCAQFGAGSRPDGLAYDTTYHQYVYVSNYNSGNVSIYNGTDDATVASISVGTLPRGPAFDPANSYVYVPNYGSSSISVITGASLYTTLTGTYAPFDAAYNPGNDYMFVSEVSSGGSPGLVDAISSSNSLTKVYLLDNDATYLAYDSITNYMYVATSTSTGDPAICYITSSLSPSTSCLKLNTVSGTISDLIFDSATGNLYASDSANNVVYVVGTAPFSLVSTISVGNSPMSLAWDPAGILGYGMIWVANELSNSLSQIWTKTNGVTATVAVGSDPDYIVDIPNAGEEAVSISGSNAVDFVNNLNAIVLNKFVTGSAPGPLMVNWWGVVYDADTSGGTITVSPNTIPTPTGPGPTWHSQASSTAGARADAAMTYINGSTDKFLVYGGLDSTGSPLADSWIGTASSWTSVCPSTGCTGGPPALWGASLLSGDGWTVMFGGCTTPAPCTAVSSSTWEYVGGATPWVLLSPSTSPPGRYDASVGADGNSNVAILFGGRNYSQALGDTWEFSFIAGTPTWGQPTSPGTPPSSRFLAAMTYDLSDPTEQMVLFGGSTWTGAPLGDTYAFTGFVPGSVTSGSWAKLTPATAPAPRFGAGMTWFGQGIRSHGTGAYVLLFGGTDGVSSVFSDTWIFYGGSWYPYYPTVMPTASYDVAMGYSWTAQSALLYSGFESLTGQTTYADQYTYY